MRGIMTYWNERWRGVTHPYTESSSQLFCQPFIANVFYTTVTSDQVIWLVERCSWYNSTADFTDIITLYRCSNDHKWEWERECCCTEHQHQCDSVAGTRPQAITFIQSFNKPFLVVNSNKEQEIMVCLSLLYCISASWTVSCPIKLHGQN